MRGAVWIADRRRRGRLPAALLKRAARAALEDRGLWPCGLSIAVVGGAEMRRLNRRWLRHDFDTDVLSFPMGGPGLVGELVVSADFAEREARERGLEAREELVRYVVHGVLHLAGMDDHRPAERRRMWAVQERLVAAITGS